MPSTFNQSEKGFNDFSEWTHRNSDSLGNVGSIHQLAL